MLNVVHLKLTNIISSSYYEEKIFNHVKKKKQLLNLFKLKCEWGIRLSGVTKTLFLLTMLVQYQTDK